MKLTTIYVLIIISNYLELINGATFRTHDFINDINNGLYKSDLPENVQTFLFFLLMTVFVVIFVTPIWLETIRKKNEV